jgi:hypothetical protein
MNSATLFTAVSPQLIWIVEAPKPEQLNAQFVV